MIATRASVVCIASWNVDLIVRMQRPAERGETLMASQFDMLPGGKGSNAAVACARQGAPTALIARLGDDDFGQMALRLWGEELIDSGSVVRASGERSGVAQIRVYADGDNSIAVAPGAGAGLCAEHVEAAYVKLAGARVVMASNEVPQVATTTAFRIARQHDAITLLNPAPAVDLPDELVELCDLLTPNQHELLQLAGLPLDASIDEAAGRLLDRGVPALIVTLGGDGCRLYRAGQVPVSLPGYRVKLADTIGAGDTFTGALAAALARGENLIDAARCANAAAALSVQGHGALGGMPTLAAVEAFLARAE
jgi:ribokinase